MPTALITGASTGLGAEYARQLAAAGHDLVLVARTESALRELAAELSARHGVDAEVLPADLLEPQPSERVAQRLAEESRPIDMLINNAGYGLGLAFERNDVDAEVRHLRLHNEIPLRLMHAALPGMLKRRSGTIINMASVAAFVPRSTYGASKRWLVEFSRWANQQYRRRGVHVTAVCPGYTHTEFHARLGLPKGQEGIPNVLWLNAPDVVAESLRATARGRAVSIPSLRYKALVAAARFVPTGILARAAATAR